MQNLNQWFDINQQPIEAINPNNRGFLYADGCFTTIAVVNGLPQLWQYHHQRLQQGINCFGFYVDIKLLEKQAFLYAQKIGFGVLKIILNRALSDKTPNQKTPRRGYAPNTNLATVYFHCMSSEADKPSNIENHIEAIKLNQACQLALIKPNDFALGQVSPMLSGLKTLARTEQVLAVNALDTFKQRYLIKSDIPDGFTQKALVQDALLQDTLFQDAFVKDALLCDTQGNVIEAISSNLFYKQAGQWHTPCLKQAGIAGTVRAYLLDVLPEKIQIKSLHINELTQTNVLKSKQASQNISAMFLCNAVKGIIPITGVCFDAVIDNKVVIRQLQFCFDEVADFYQSLLISTTASQKH